MNKKVLSTMIFLCWAFLVAFAIIKFWFADWFAIKINNAHIIEFGNCIDSCVYAKILCNSILGILTYWLYLCACCKKWFLKWWQYIIIAVFTIVITIIYTFKPTLASVIDICFMVLIPLLLKADHKQFVAVFIAHYLGQFIILHIRGVSLFMADTNYATQTILVIDMYIWLLLYYLYANKYKEEDLWEELEHHYLAIKQKLKSLKKSKD